MSNMSDFVSSLGLLTSLRCARVSSVQEGGAVMVQFDDTPHGTPCRVLTTSSAPLALYPGDEVLIWVAASAIVLGKVGPYHAPGAITLEAEGDIVLRNRGARIRLGADGEVEIACKRFTTRSQRLLQLLAPMIKLN
jgi:hypothetical protein